MGVIIIGKKFINLARNLRKRQTDSENLLWRHLRKKQIEGFKFRRQHPIGDYIVDFVCLENRLILEVDGSQHKAADCKDAERDAWLQNEGYKILRIWSNDVIRNIEGVIEAIMNNCLDNSSLDIKENT